MDARIVRCRMLNAKADQCTAEAVDPEGEVLICQRHAALTLELLTVHFRLLEARSAKVEAQAKLRQTERDFEQVRDGLQDIRAGLRTVASDG